MKDFIESKSDYDQYTFITSALNNFLYKNGCDDRKVAEKYLNDVFNQSPSESTWIKFLFLNLVISSIYFY